jgi:hypothetical protein
MYLRKKETSSYEKVSVSLIDLMKLLIGDQFMSFQNFQDNSYCDVRYFQNKQWRYIFNDKHDAFEKLR